MNSWKEGLKGMTTKQIYSALSLSTQKCKWPPTPAEFRELVEEDIDYPTMFGNAQLAYSTGKWDSPLQYHAAQKFGAFELRNASMDAKHINRFKDIVDSLKDEKLDFPEHINAPQLPAPGQTHNREVAINYLAKAKEILKGDVK